MGSNLADKKCPLVLALSRLSEVSLPPYLELKLGVEAGHLCMQNKIVFRELWTQLNMAWDLVLCMLCSYLYVLWSSLKTLPACI